MDVFPEGFGYGCFLGQAAQLRTLVAQPIVDVPDRKSTRLNSSHGYISYAGFCLNKSRCSIRTWCCIAMVEPVVGETAAERVKVMVPGVKGMHKGFQITYVNVGSLREECDPSWHF